MFPLERMALTVICNYGTASHSTWPKASDTPDIINHMLDYTKVDVLGDSRCVIEGVSVNSLEHLLPGPN